jgi:hypothetical protein
VDQILPDGMDFAKIIAGRTAPMRINATILAMVNYQR